MRRIGGIATVCYKFHRGCFRPVRDLAHVRGSIPVMGRSLARRLCRETWRRNGGAA